jgi:hypothetical protein
MPLNRELEYIEKVNDRRNRRYFEILLASALGVSALIWYLLGW